MKKNIPGFIVLLAFLSVITGCSSSRISKTSPLTLKILSYNIHHANPPSKSAEGLIDMESIAKVIRESGADLVGLQEIDVHTIRSGKELDQAKKLGEMTNMYSHFVKGIDYQGGEYGIAILSKFPILRADSLRLPMKPGIGGEPRVMAVITVEPVKGQKINFATTHLELNKENRELQAAAISHYFENTKSPVILCGDFNAKPESVEIKNLDLHFKRSSIPNGFTIPHLTPNREIDFIMYRPENRFKVLKHVVIDESYASDHRPVFVELQLQ